MPAVAIPPKNNAGNLPVCALMKKPVGRRESETPKIKLAPEIYASRNIEI